MKSPNPITLAGRSAGTAAALLAIALLTGTAGTASAAGRDDRADRFPISVAEAEAHRAEIFANIDSNGDGLISAEEFDAAESPRGKRGHPRPPAADGKRPGDGHGKPSEEKLAAMDAAMFDALDTNADDVLSRDEFSHAAMREVRRSGMKARFFERADADGDGYLSPDEFPPHRLADLDANGDGEITRDEMPGRQHRKSHRSSD